MFTADIKCSLDYRVWKKLTRLYSFIALGLAIGLVWIPLIPFFDQARYGDNSSLQLFIVFILLICYLGAVVPFLVIGFNYTKKMKYLFLFYRDFFYCEGTLGLHHETNKLGRAYYLVKFEYEGSTLLKETNRIFLTGKKKGDKDFGVETFDGAKVSFLYDPKTDRIYILRQLFY